MTMRLVLGVLVIALSAAGCAGSAPGADQPEVNIAGGFYLELWVLGEENYATLYRVNGARELGFGGGRDAFNRNINWVGELPETQYSELQGLLDRHGWFAGTVESTGIPKERISRIELTWPGGSRRFKVKGDSPGIEPVQRLLDDAARQRLRKDLDRLPQAGEERYR